jgi:PKD repeat protein
MAAPTVAGVAALLKSHHRWFTHTETETLLINYTDDVYASNPGYVGKLGSGRVNAYTPLSILTTTGFRVDVTFGHTPFDVNFTDVSPNAPSGPYLYEFGDGNEATTADATNTYDGPGVYTVSFTASVPSGPHIRTKVDHIIVVENTIQYQSIMIPVDNGSKEAVPVGLHNTHTLDEIYLPFKLTGTPQIFIDSLTLGSRTADWTSQVVFDNRLSGEISSRLRASGGTPVEAGDGIVANLRVRTGPVSSPNMVETVNSARISSHYLHLVSQWADFVGGTITVYNPCSCPFQAVSMRILLSPRSTWRA